jgi:hypothetical protein
MPMRSKPSAPATPAQNPGCVNRLVATVLIAMMIAKSTGASQGYLRGWGSFTAWSGPVGRWARKAILGPHVG